MRLSDIMSEAVETVTVEATVEEARDVMRRENVRHLVVVQAGQTRGVVSHHDLRGQRGGALVRAVMTTPLVTATPHTTLRQAANLMRGNHVGCLPILDDRQRLQGIVTDSDLLDLIGKGVTRGPEVEGRPRNWVPGR